HSRQPQIRQLGSNPMQKSLVLLALIAMAAIPAFAIDGQVLINESTVMAQGGYPYKITKPGSYKLTGNLSITTSLSGNYSGVDVVIGIQSSNVTLDLNGFTITVNNNLSGLTHSVYAIAELGSFSQVAVQNGSITLSSTAGPLATPSSAVGVYLASTKAT